MSDNHKPNDENETLAADLTAFALGELPADEAARLQRLIPGDPSAQAELAKTRRLAEVLRAGSIGESVTERDSTSARNVPTVQSERTREAILDALDSERVTLPSQEVSVSEAFSLKLVGKSRRKLQLWLGALAATIAIVLCSVVYLNRDAQFPKVAQSSLKEFQATREHAPPPDSKDKLAQIDELKKIPSDAERNVRLEDRAEANMADQGNAAGAASAAAIARSAQSNDVIRTIDRANALESPGRAPAKENSAADTPSLAAADSFGASGNLSKSTESNLASAASEKAFFDRRVEDSKSSRLPSQKPSKLQSVRNQSEAWRLVEISAKAEPKASWVAKRNRVRIQATPPF